jgi:hypothetical protein
VLLPTEVVVGSGAVGGAVGDRGRGADSGCSRGAVAVGGRRCGGVVGGRGAVAKAEADAEQRRCRCERSEAEDRGGGWVAEEQANAAEQGSVDRRRAVAGAVVD